MRARLLLAVVRFCRWRIKDLNAMSTKAWQHHDHETVDYYRERCWRWIKLLNWAYEREPLASAIRKLKRG